MFRLETTEPEIRPYSLGWEGGGAWAKPKYKALFRFGGEGGSGDKPK